jgi:Spy/CpxP family protein refolding chaperone
MKHSGIAVLVAMSLVAAPVLGTQHQPYAREQSREIKALSAEEVKQYLSGAGMGYAKAAELNHFPGPMHLLELAHKLGLTSEQRADVGRLMDAHKAEARAVGARLVESERALDALFRSGKVEPQALAEAVRAAGAAAAEYRLSHLETHRRTRALLSAEQVARYDELRGYARPAATEDAHRHH